MRLAIISDVHGNLRALEAVLAEPLHVGGGDRRRVLGDLGGEVHDRPVAGIERLGHAFG